MKIFVNARFLTQPVSGVQRYAIECSRKIKKIWPDTRFLSPENVWNKDVFAELNAEIIGKNTGQMWEQWDLPRFANGNGQLPLLNPCNTAPLLYKKNFTTIHDLAFYHHPEWNSKKFSTWYNFLIPRIAKNSRHVFTVSETIASELTDHYFLPKEKISVTYNGISDVMLGQQTDSAPAKSPVILCVGTFNIRKNQGALIDAFLQSEIQRTHKLVLVGDKNAVFKDSHIEKQILKSEKIEIVTGISEAELASLYRKAEIVVSTSLYEGFGIPLLEGLANNCKLICSDIQVYRELYANVATFCDPGNIGSIAAALDAVAGSPLPDKKNVAMLLTKYSYQHAAEVITSTIARA